MLLMIGFFPNTAQASTYTTFGSNILGQWGANAFYSIVVNRGYYWAFVHFTGTGLGTGLATGTNTAYGTSPTITKVYQVLNGTTTISAFFKIDCSAMDNNQNAYISFQAADTTITSYSVVVVKTARFPSANPLDERTQMFIDIINQQTGRKTAESVRDSLSNQKRVNSLLKYEDINGLRHNIVEMKSEEPIRSEGWVETDFKEGESFLPPEQGELVSLTRNQALDEFKSGDRHDKLSLFERVLSISPLKK